MIHLFIKGQVLQVDAPTIVAGTIDYLSARFCFQSSDWDGLQKWAHFENGDTVYDIELVDDRIEKDKHLNLSEGEWSVWLHGSEYVDGELTMRITTAAVRLVVLPTGTTDTDNPFPSATPSVVEQIYADLDNTVQAAVNNAIPDAVGAALKTAKESGEFDGKDGAEGKSAYQTALDNGFEGTEAEWLESLKVKGDPGDTPVKGEDYYTEEDKAEIVAEVVEEVGGKQVQPDWSQNDDTQPDYVKNRTHWVETSGEASVVEILPETVLEEPSIMFEGEDISTSFVDGETYTVKWNGVEYDTLCQYMTDDGITFPVLGDIYTASGGNMGTAATGEPFVMLVYTPEAIGTNSSALVIQPFDETLTELTISITGKSGAVITYHPLDKRFIPAHWLANRREVTRTIASGVTSLGDFTADQFENAIELYITFDLNGETITDTLKVTATDKYGTFLGASGEYFNFTNYSMSPTGDVSVWWNPGENWPESYTVSGKFYEYDKIPFNYLTSVELDLTDYDTSQNNIELAKYISQFAIALRHGVTVRYKGGTLLAAYGDIDMGYWSVTWADDYGVHHEGCYFGSDLPRSAEIPAVTADDTGKIMTVENGVWVAKSAADVITAAISNGDEVSY